MLTRLNSPTKTELTEFLQGIRTPAGLGFSGRVVSDFCGRVDVVLDCKELKKDITVFSANFDDYGQILDFNFPANAYEYTEFYLKDMIF